MDRTAFEYLYLHANALVELGVMRATAALIAASQAEPTSEQVAARAAFSDAVAGAVMNPDPDKLDWSAFDGIEIPSGLEEPASDSAPAVDLGPSFEEAMESVGDDDDDFESVPELEPYLQRLYAAGPLLAVRITAHHDAGDASLDAALMALDTGPAPLHGPLTPAQLLAWLERYEAQDEAVLRVVQLMRSLDPPPGGAWPMQ